MHGARLYAEILRQAFSACLGCLLLLSVSSLEAQTLDAPAAGRPKAAPLTNQQIVDVQIVGNRTVAVPEIRAVLRTRAGQSFDPISVRRDVKAITRTRKFQNVNVKTKQGPQPGTVVVIFQVFEFPEVEYLHLLGNDSIKSKNLINAAEIAVGDSLDAASVESARKKLVDFYKERGYNKVKIDVREGLGRKDVGVVYVINEGPQQQIWTLDFVGNTIISDGRLKTQIESKPHILKYTMFGKGYVNLKQIDADVERLESYYRGMGYLLARVGREMEYGNDDTKLSLKFVIDEGPQFKIRNVIINGNQVYNDPQLNSLLILKSGEFFNGPAMQKDLKKLTEAYGAVGYIMADVKPTTRTLERTPEVDLVYDIEEGSRYRVGKIDVHIGGDSPHTKLSVALNRLSLRPGDVIDIREIHRSERRMQSSGLFAVDPIRGLRPKVVFKPVEKKKSESSIARKRGNVVRGQSPDPPWQRVEIEFVPYSEPTPANSQGIYLNGRPAPGRYQR